MMSKPGEVLFKRSVKPKQTYSPSNPQVNDKYHLATDSATGNMIIVANSSIKRFCGDGTITLNDGRTIEIILSGTKKTCMDYWSTEIRLLKDMNDVKRNENEDDDSNDETTDLLEPTFQNPTTTFSTPAPYRKKRKIVRQLSSESINSNASPKRTVHDNHSNFFRTQHNNIFSSQTANVKSKETSLTVLSSDDEENTNGKDKRAFSCLLKELEHSREENRAMSQQLTKLTNKMSQFGSMLRSNNNQDLDRYRDPNNLEEFKTEIMYKDTNLLEVPAANAGEYARRLLLVLFDLQELQTSLLPSQQSKRYSKPELNHERFHILNDAIRTRYRISKHHYENFYKERIKETLAGCIYNVGVRKAKGQTARHQQATDEDLQTIEQ